MLEKEGKVVGATSTRVLVSAEACLWNVQVMHQEIHGKMMEIKER